MRAAFILVVWAYRWRIVPNVLARMAALLAEFVKAAEKLRSRYGR